MDMRPKFIRYPGGLIDSLHALVAFEQVVNEEAVIVDAHIQH